MAEYLVRKIETCQECNGVRMITHPDWESLNHTLKHLASISTEPTPELWNRLVDEYESNGGNAPEEIKCPECEGTGKTEAWISLEQALQEIGLWMPADWAERAEAEDWAKQGVPY